jgi:hypothetical protein
MKNILCPIVLSLSLSAGLPAMADGAPITKNPTMNPCDQLSAADPKLNECRTQWKDAKTDTDRQRIQASFQFPAPPPASANPAANPAAGGLEPNPGQPHIPGNASAPR